jgi:DNA polymerase-1
MLTRPLFPKQRDVFLIVDNPTKSELEEGDAFSAPSNMNLLTSLRTGKLYASAKTQEIKGILPTKIYKTYLDYRDKTEYDYKDSFCKRKDLIETEYGFVKKEDNNVEENYVVENSWHKLEHQKDCFVKKELWTEFQNLLEEIRKVEPKLIIITGKWAFFFLSGVVTLTGTQGTLKDKKILGGLAKFRSSSMLIWEGFNIQNHVLIPIWHTLNAVTMQDKTFIILADIQKVIWAYYTIIEKGVEFFTEVKHEYLIGTNKEQILNYFDELLNLNNNITISIDIETMFQAVIDCIGFSYENNRGLCVPFCSADNSSVWSYEDELEITLKMFEVLNSKQVQFNTVGQNFSYDAQYIYRFYGIKVNAKHDTMILNHVLFNYLPKDLAFLASIYCPRYKYWKDEITADKESPETRWEYNVKDICWTREILEAQLDILATRPEKQQTFYEFQANNIAPCLQEMMYIGVRVDKDKKEVLHNKLKEILEQIEATINNIFQYSIPNIEINLKSPKQIGALFTDLLKIKPIIDKKRKTVTFGSDAMLIYRDENPEYYPLITLILEYRSIGIFVRTFLGAELDEDDRLRTAYNAAGTKSYRLSSRKNAFGKGLNMANIPSKGKIALNYSLDLESIDNENELEGLEDIRLVEEESITKLPNCKEIFLPDEGTVFWNADYSGADAMVVAWDSNCEFLINFFSTSKEKLYIYVVREYLQQEITSEHPFYKKAKQFIHLTNYGGMEAKAAASSGLDIVTARNLRNWYFSKCPEILEWHKRIASEVNSRGYIENIFGARFYLLDKNCPTLLNQAYALIPQSTIAILINKGIVNIYKNETDLVFGKAKNNNPDRNSIIPLLQVHDAASGIFKDKGDKENDETMKRIVKHLEIELPYQRPLIIPADGSWSRQSYGHCK